MQSKIDRVMCGTCVYWNGNRECIDNNTKVVFFDDTAMCRCPISSKSGQERRRDLRCKRYLNFLKI